MIDSSGLKRADDHKGSTVVVRVTRREIVGRTLTENPSKRADSNVHSGTFLIWMSFNGTQKIILIGASAIELELVADLVAQLPSTFPVPVLLALHSVFATEKEAVLRALSKAAVLTCSYAEDGQEIPLSGIHIAPPSRHMLIEKNRIRVVFGPRENCHRPALDPLFRTAGLSLGHRSIAVLLCGFAGDLKDGLAGMNLLQERGGITIIPQFPSLAPAEILSFGSSSIFRRVTADHRPAPEHLPTLLQELVEREAAPNHEARIDSVAG